MARNIEKTEITKAQARKLTDKIKSAADQLWSLLLEAHEGGAWKALGYKTWEAYIGAEFDMSRRQSYNLLDQGRIIREIESAAGARVHDRAQITVAKAQTIKPVIEEVTQEIRAKVAAGADPVQTTYEVIEAKRVERKVEPPAKPKLVAVPNPDPEADNYDGPTLDDLIDELQDENRRLRAEIEAAEADDLAAEAVKWRRIAENAQRQQGEAMDRVIKEQRVSRRIAKTLHACCKELGVDDPSKLLRAIRELSAQKVAA